MHPQSCIIPIVHLSCNCLLVFSDSMDINFGRVTYIVCSLSIVRLVHFNIHKNYFKSIIYSIYIDRPPAPLGIDVTQDHAQSMIGENPTLGWGIDAPFLSKEQLSLYSVAVHKYFYVVYLWAAAACVLCRSSRLNICQIQLDQRVSLICKWLENLYF